MKMKRNSTRVLALLLACACISVANAQPSWEITHSGMNDVELLAVQMIDTQLAFVVGDSGTILRSNDGGVSWLAQESGTKLSLGSVSFSSTTVGTAVGDSGIILRTTDAGQSWHRQSSGVNVFLTSVSFSDANHGWAVGDSATILATVDGGEHWMNQSVDTLTHIDWLSCVVAHDAQKAWATGMGGAILRTTDGGFSWEELPSKTYADLYGIAMVDGWYGMTVGMQGANRTTTNGGNSWIINANAVNGRLLAIAHNFGEYWTAVGENGIIVRTTNGGDSWKPMESPVQTDLIAVWFAEANTGLAVGKHGVIVRAINSNITSVKLIDNTTPTTTSPSACTIGPCIDAVFPNPAHNAAQIQFRVSEQGAVIVDVVDALGRSVATLANEWLQAGAYDVQLELMDKPAGVYSVRVRSNRTVATHRLLVVD